MQSRRRFKQTRPFEERLAEEAHELRRRAEELSPSREREATLRKARQDEIAARLTEWLTSPGLRSPQ